MQNEEILAEQTGIDVLDVPWTARDVWWGFAIFGLWMVIAIAFSLLSAYLAWELNPGLVVSFWEATLLIPLWLLVVRKYGVSWEALGLRGFRGRALGIGCGLLLFAFMFNCIYGLILAQFDLQIQTDWVAVFSELSSPWLMFLGGVVIAPVVEELFFRGFVFAGLRKRYGWKKAVVISSLFFALLHLTPTAILPIFFLGCIFAYLYHRSNSIWPGTLLHALMNGFSMGLAYLVSTMDLSSLGGI
jgi:membrane protease YdiL (CAAX protease family)